MIDPAEKKRLLIQRAKRILESSGYSLKQLQSGGYLIAVFDADLQEQVITEFPDIISVGTAFGLWADEGPGDRDPETGLDRPSTAALRESL